MRAKARQRLALREALQSTSRRHPAEVLLDAVHALDVIEREARAALGQGATPEQLDRWLTAVVDAAAMARTALSASAEDTVARARAAATEAMSEVEAMARLRQIRDEADRRLARAEVEP